MPTKTEQADLLQAIVGRNGECPIAVVAPATPAECFDIAIEAVRLAIEHMCPVAYLLATAPSRTAPSRGTLPDLDDLEPDPTSVYRTDPENFAPFLRDERLVRPWAIPGTPGLEHRIGGIEKEDVTGNISYDPENHEQHGAHAPGQDRQDRRPPAARGDRRAREPATCWSSAGAAPTARCARPRCSYAPRAQPSVTPPALPEPAAVRTSASSCAATGASWSRS